MLQLLILFLQFVFPPKVKITICEHVCHILKKSEVRKVSNQYHRLLTDASRVVGVHLLVAAIFLVWSFFDLVPLESDDERCLLVGWGLIGVREAQVGCLLLIGFVQGVRRQLSLDHLTQVVVKWSDQDAVESVFRVKIAFLSLLFRFFWSRWPLIHLFYYIIFLKFF